jgi:IS6 family transposase
MYRAVDENGQIIDVYLSARRNTRAARRFLTTVMRGHGEPVEVMTDRAPALRAVIEELMPAAFHNTPHYANKHVECDHGRRDSDRCAGLNAPQRASQQQRASSSVQGT